MIRINLLPIEDRIREDDSKNGLWVILGLSAVGSVCLMLLFCYTLQGRALAELTEEVAMLETLSAKYRPLIERVNQITRERRDIEAKIQVISELDLERSYRIRLLEDLNRKMPRYAWLTKFSELGGAMAEIQGRTFSNLVVSDFMTSLEESDYYSTVDLTVAKRAEVGERDLVEFRLVTALQNPRPGEAGEDESLQARAEY